MAIYYIGTTGSNDNAGTRDAPFATIEAIANQLQPGDSVYYLKGTYTNATYGETDENGVRDIWKTSQDTIVKLNDVHGEEGNPITISPEPGADVIFQYDGNGAFVLRGSSHIEIQGFTIEGPNATLSHQDALDAQWTYRIATSTDADGNPVYEYFQRDPSEVLETKISDIISDYAALGIDQSGSGKPLLFNAPAISLPNGSHHIVITNNTIHDSAAHAISGHGGNDFVTVSGNEIYNNNWYTSNGTHAISFKGLDSMGTDPDAFTIQITDNHIHDNYNLLISWVMTKLFVTPHVDEGKSIHIQNSISTVDGQTGHQWDIGRILIENNLIERAGNAAITLNDVRGATVTNNTIIDGGYFNQLLAQDGDQDSEFFGIFSAQGLSQNDTVQVGGLRLTDADDNAIYDNVISLSDDSLFVVDSSNGTDALNTIATDNYFTGGNGVRIRSESDGTGLLHDGFVLVDTVGIGGVAADKLIGSAGVDYLGGGGDADYLSGEGGDDILTGGEGGDIFHFGNVTGTDTITDFDSSEDVIVFGNGLWRVDQLEVFESGTSLWIKTAKGMIELENMSLESFDFSSIQFRIYSLTPPETDPIVSEPSDFDLSSLLKSIDTAQTLSVMQSYDSFTSLYSDGLELPFQFDDYILG